MKTLLLGTCLFVTLCFASCVNKHDIGGETPTPEPDKTNPFDFKTSREAVISISYPLQVHTKVEIFTQNPVSLDDVDNYVKDGGLEPIATGYTDAKGQLRLSLRIADFTNELFVYSESSGAPILLRGELNGKTEISINESNSFEPKSKSGTRAISDSKVYWKNWAKQNITFRSGPDWSWNATGTPNYLLAEGLQITDKMMAIIDQTIPKGEDLDLRFSSLDDIAISENANVKIYFISNSSARRNTIAYYTYAGTTKPTLAEINKSATVIFPNLSKDGLKAGNGVELQYYNGTNWSKTFPKGVKIGFVLLVDAWNNGNLATNDCYAVYSEKSHNNYNIPELNSIMANRPHMAAFKAENKFILTFEDLPWNQRRGTKYPGDFSDDVFVLEANPEIALPPVDNGVDPDNPDYGMEIKSKGILSFEDLWPYKGDYDMNDVVVKYTSSAFMKNEAITAFIDEYTFLNNGGQSENGFGIEFNYPESEIKSLEMTATNGIGAPVVDRNPLLNNATLMLFKDAAAVPVGTVFRIKGVFKNGRPPFSYKQAPYNPFIVINNQNNDNIRREVHMVNYKPTPRANMLLFNTGNDLSKPDKGIYYVSSAAYPFAIDIVGADSYQIPAEMQAIDKVYPNFPKWVASGGKDYKDWYQK